jgi:hypothetical protein
MLSLDLPQLLAYLLEKKFTAHIQQETNQLCVLFTVDKKEYPAFIRFAQNSDLLQILTFIPRTIKPTAFADTARLLHMFNKEIDLPGFGMNEETGHLFFRCAIPCPKGKVDGQVLEAFLNSTQVVCKNFGHAIETVAEGLISYDDLIKKAKGKQP